MKLPVYLLFVLVVKNSYSQNGVLRYFRSVDIGIEVSPVLNFSSFKENNPIDPRFKKEPFIGHTLGLNLSKKIRKKINFSTKISYSTVGFRFKNQETYLPLGRFTSASISNEKFEFINLQLALSVSIGENKFTRNRITLGLGILHNPSDQKRPSSNGISETIGRSIDRISKDSTTILVVTKGRDFQGYQIGIVADYNREISTSKNFQLTYFISARFGLSPLFKSSLNITRQNFQRYKTPYIYENTTWNHGHYVGFGIKLGLKSKI